MVSLLFGLVCLFVNLMLSLVLRRDRLAFAIGWAVLVLVNFLLTREASVINLILIAIGMAIFLIAPLWCYGLLATVSLFFFFQLRDFTITTEFTAWYATGFVLHLVLLVAVAVYGFYTSLAGQKPFGGKFLEE